VDENSSFEETVEQDERSETVGIWTLLKWMPLMLAFYGFAIFLFKGAYVWVPTFLKETYGFSPSKAIVFSAILPAIGIFSNYLMGKFSDHFGRRSGLVLVFSILGICFFSLYLGTRSILIPLLIVLGFFLNSFSGIINAYTGDYVPSQIMGKAFGMVFTFSICVSSLAPYIMGVISDRSSLAMSMAFLGAVSFVGAVVALKKPTRIGGD
jgi:sugar phosphate permease